MNSCPNCYSVTRVREGAGHECASCGWGSGQVGGIVEMLSQSDRESRAFKEYLTNYDEIAEDDLSESILDRTYIGHQANNMIKYIGKVTGCRVCELGVGQGVLAKSLVSAGAESVVAIDISLPYLKRIENIKSIEPVLANAENIPYIDEFDIVTSTDVMEHVLNVGSYLISVNRSLKISGRAYVRVPYRESLLKYSPKMGCKYEYVHLRNFNKKLLRDMFVDAGFSVRKYHIDGYSIFTPQDIYMNNKSFKKVYELIQKKVLEKIGNPSDVNEWNSLLCRVFMRPHEIVVEAVKEKHIEIKSEC